MLYVQLILEDTLLFLCLKLCISVSLVSIKLDSVDIQNARRLNII